MAHCRAGEVECQQRRAGGNARIREWRLADVGPRLQDVGLYADFRCSGPCEAGALFRAEKTLSGWKGIYVSLTEPDTPSYSVTLDAQGKILTREKLRRG